MASQAYLTEKGRRIPGDLSLVSFDDAPLALHNDLSSYNFNHEALAASMLGFILKRRPYSNADARVAGFLTERGTLGPAPGAR